MIVLVHVQECVFLNVQQVVPVVPLALVVQDVVDAQTVLAHVQNNVIGTVQADVVHVVDVLDVKDVVDVAYYVKLLAILKENEMESYVNLELSLELISYLIQSNQENLCWLMNHVDLERTDTWRDKQFAFIKSTLDDLIIKRNIILDLMEQKKC